MVIRLGERDDAGFREWSTRRQTCSRRTIVVVQYN